MIGLQIEQEIALSCKSRYLKYSYAKRSFLSNIFMEFVGHQIQTL